MMLRKMGHYQRAQQKLDIAKQLDKDNIGVIYEQQILNATKELNEDIDLEQGPALRRMLPGNTNQSAPSRNGVCKVMCRNICSIF